MREEGGVDIEDASRFEEVYDVPRDNVAEGSEYAYGLLRGCYY